MSQHTFTTENGQQIVLGWDRAMGTYFAQVWDRTGTHETEGEEPVLWVGCTSAELPDLEALEASLSDHISHIPCILHTTLLVDKLGGR